MSEIPEDVWKTAAEVWGSMPKEGAGIAHVALAILAERERCAKIAEGRSKTFDFQKALSDYDDMAYGSNVARSEIALAIRN